MLGLIVVLVVVLSRTLGFSPLVGQHRSFCRTLRLRASEGESYETVFPGAEILQVSLTHHKPLGCTVDESLADKELKPVFVSKVST